MPPFATENGLIAADLGGGVIKQRVGRPGQGKSGGFRTIIAFKAGDRSIFILGFAKSEGDNITASGLFALRRLASELLVYTQETIARALAGRLLIEVPCHAQTVS